MRLRGRREKTALQQSLYRYDIGNGSMPGYEGLQNIKPVHLHRNLFHKHPIPEADDPTHTHFYCWHIDAVLYRLYPPNVTSLLAFSVPKGRTKIQGETNKSQQRGGVLIVHAIDQINYYD